MTMIARPFRIGLVAVALAVGGCGSTGLYDRNTKYRVDNASSGFTLTVAYSRTHFVPEPEAVEEACKNAFVTVAQYVAAKKGRRTQRIDEQDIATKLDRDEKTDVLTCTATGPVAWQ